MPIRHCQKCGLKVLIDESQASVNPFYCQRCTASIKNEEAPSGTTPREVGKGAKPGTVRVQCPYCKATFNGRVPQRPARGACPVCQKELILLPTGDIRPAAGFDPIRWQREQAAKKATEEAPAAESPPPETPAEPQMPSWMDEGASAAAAAPESAAPAAAPEAAPEPPAEEIPLPEAAAEDILRGGIPEPSAPAPPEPPAEAVPEAPSPEEPPPEPVPSEPAEPTPLEGPSPEPPPKPAVAVPRKSFPSGGRGTGRRGMPAAEHPLPARSGMGLAVLAFFLMILPAVACPILYSSRQGLKNLADPVGERLSRGFQDLHRMLCPPPAWKPPTDAPVPEKKQEGGAAEEKLRPGPEDRKRDEEEIIRLWTEYMREKRTLDQKDVGATETEKEAILKSRQELKKKLDAVEALKARYKETHGTPFEPREQ